MTLLTLHPAKDNQMASHYTILAMLTALTAFQGGATLASAAPPLSTTARDFLGAHNQARAAVGVPPLSWSETLANATSRVARYQRNQKKCEFASLKPGKYGANQLWAKGKSMTPKMAVEAWVKEKEFYDYGKNTCAGNHKCDVYKQVVWRNSTQLGCAQATCAEEQIVLTICFYNPPGNFVGERPY